MELNCDANKQAKLMIVALIITWEAASGFRENKKIPSELLVTGTSEQHRKKYPVLLNNINATLWLKQR